MIKIKTDKEIELMRKAGEITKNTLLEVEKYIKPGVTTKFLDKIAYDFMRARMDELEEKFDEQQERLSYFEKQISKLGNLEEKFEQQEERIDRLEMTIEKILSAVEDIDDSKVNKKIDKLDKQLAKLSINIEKLTAYVD